MVRTYCFFNRNFIDDDDEIYYYYCCCCCCIGIWKLWIEIIFFYNYVLDDSIFVSRSFIKTIPNYHRLIELLRKVCAGIKAKITELMKNKNHVCEMGEFSTVREKYLFVSEPNWMIKILSTTKTMMIICDDREFINLDTNISFRFLNFYVAAKAERMIYVH